MKIAVVGLGLIGGSFCKAIKKKTKHTCLGIDRDQTVLEKALQDQAIDLAILPQELSQADFTIVCLHPLQTIGFIRKNKPYFRKGSIVMDVCGIKTEIVKAVAAQLSDSGVHFVAAHPMAGREFSGYDYSDERLFEKASFLLASLPDNEQSEQTAAQLAGELGFGQVVFTTPQKHDEVIAFTSQLAHIVSNAYVKTPLLFESQGFTAGSFLDLTRVARLNEEMWTELFLLNREPLLAALDNLGKKLCEVRTALEDNNAGKLKALLKEGRVLKEKSAIPDKTRK